MEFHQFINTALVNLILILLFALSHLHRQIYCQSMSRIEANDITAFDQYWIWDTVNLNLTNARPNSTTLPDSSTIYHFQPINSSVSFYDISATFDIGRHLCDMSTVRVHVEYFGYLAAVNLAYRTDGGYVPFRFSSNGSWSTLSIEVDSTQNVSIKIFNRQQFV